VGRRAELDQVSSCCYVGHVKTARYGDEGHVIDGRDAYDDGRVYAYGRVVLRERTGLTLSQRVVRDSV